MRALSWLIRRFRAPTLSAAHETVRQSGHRQSEQEKRVDAQARSLAELKLRLSRLQRPQPPPPKEPKP